MAEQFLFFNSIGGDRLYGQEEFSEFLQSIVNTGLIRGQLNQLEVTADGSSLDLDVDTGRAYVEGFLYINDTIKTLSVDAETIGNNRIDRIVVKLDKSTGSRSVQTLVLKGTPAPTPIAPSLTRTGDVYEISLAQVLVTGGQSFVNQNDITDERGLDSICPYADSNILPGVAIGDLKYFVDSGTINNFSGTVDDLDVYLTGITLIMQASNTNTGPSTLNVNGIGSEPLGVISKGQYRELFDNEINENDVLIITRDSVNNRFIVITNISLLSNLFGGELIDITLTPTVQFQTITETIVSSGLDFTITGETTVVSNKLVSSQDFRVKTNNLGDTEETETVLPYVLGSVPSIADTIVNTNGDLILNENISDIVVFDGSESWIPFGVPNQTLTIAFSRTDAFYNGITNVVSMKSTFGDNTQSFDALFSNDVEGIALGTGGGIFIRVLRSKLSTQDLIGFIAWLGNNSISSVLQLATPTTQKLPQVSSPKSFKDSTTVTIEDAYIKDELANVSSNVSGTIYYINTIGISGVDNNPLKNMVDEIKDIIFDGESILSLGSKDPSFAYGNERWAILSTAIAENNIDVDKILIKYTHLESNGQTNLTGNFRNALAEAHNRTTLELGKTQEQLDIISEIFNNSIGNLGGASVSDFDITLAGICSWINPTSSDFKDVTLYQATFDISKMSRIALENDEGVIKYVVAGQTQATPITPVTTFHYVIIPRYASGGKNYYGESLNKEITTPDILVMLEGSDEKTSLTGGWSDLSINGNFVINANGATVTSPSITAGGYGSGKTVNLMDISGYGTLKINITSRSTFGKLDLYVKDGSDAILASLTGIITTGIKSLDISSISNARVELRAIPNQTSFGDETVVFEVYAE